MLFDTLGNGRRTAPPTCTRLVPPPPPPQVLPELTAADVNARPLLKAGALKFVTTFRTQLPKPVIGGTLPALIRLLGAEATVVHSYAATAIERCLASRVLGACHTDYCVRATANSARSRNKGARY